MLENSGATISYWAASTGLPQFDQLSHDVDYVDVCIIGAGISGLSTAYMLLMEGKSVLILDDGPIAGGETERTTAHITYVLDQRYFDLVRMHGHENTRIAAHSHSVAIEVIELIAETENIDCDFQRVPGYLFLAENDEIGTLEKELKAVHDLGFANVELVSQVPCFERECPALKFPGQAQFHVLKYLRGLAAAIVKAGGAIHSYEHVFDIEDGELVQMRTTSGRVIKAANVVIATNSPVFDWVKVHTKQAPYRTYAIGAPIARGAMDAALYWDTQDPYHYLRIQPTSSSLQDIVIVGGEDHRTGEENDSDERFSRLESWLRQHVPQAGPVQYRWSGQVYEPVDGLGFIGHDPAHGANVFISTGASGCGMTQATVSAILLTDLVCGRKNIWAKVYDPGRKPLRAPVEYIKENFNTLLQYARKFLPGEVKSVHELPPDTGAIMRIGTKQIAAYKDPDGVVHRMSAVCPHLGATVCWNACEKSWDCPAHGSRFDASGHVIDGPAIQDLSSADEEDIKKGAA